MILLTLEARPSPWLRGALLRVPDRYCPSNINNFVRRGSTTTAMIRHAELLIQHSLSTNVQSHATRAAGEPMGMLPLAKLQTLAVNSS